LAYTMPSFKLSSHQKGQKRNHQKWHLGPDPAF
jgi:hypothetical protein